MPGVTRKCLRLLGAFLLVLGLAPVLAADSQASFESWDVTQPRGKTRRIEFTTNEGTGMSVDVSPDGRWLLFDLLSHIYRVPAGGGEAQCLTQNSGIALNYHPRFSPDGRHIAFISDRAGQNNLWIMDADGNNPRRVHADLDTSLAEPAWTPDGKSIVAVRYYPHALGPWTRTNRLWLFPIDAGAAQELATSTNTLVYSPSVSPDGRYLYYHSSSMPVIAEGYFKIGTQHQLRRLELATRIDQVLSETSPRRYYHREPFYAFAPSVSPDGKWLAFARRVPGGVTKHRDVTYAQRTGLWVRNLESGEERLVIDALTPDQLETHTMYQIRLLPGYAWARDGASIVYSEGGKLRRTFVADKRTQTIAFDARVEREISQRVRPALRVADGPFEVKFPRWPALSPDGKTVAFEAAGSIWLKSSGKPRRLTRDSDQAVTVELTPAWSPDGKWLAYTTWSDEEGGHLWRAPASGGEPQRLSTIAGEYLNPAFNRDGSEIVVVRGAGSGLRGQGTGRNAWNDLVAIAVAGGPARTLTRVLPPGDEFVRPTYVRDGRIYFMSRPTAAETAATPNAAATLCSVRADGSDLQAHATFAAIADVAPSPDGRWLAFSEGESMFLTGFPTAAGPKGPALDRLAAPVHFVELTPSGGFFPRWSANGRLLYVRGPRAYEVDADRIETVRTPVREWPLDVRLPRDPASGTIALTNARILTMENRQIIDKGSILIRDNRIVALGAAVDVSRADRVVDLAGKTVMPGLIDVHAHHHGGNLDGEIIPPHRAESANYLAYGVTTTFDPSAPSQLVFPAAELTAAGKLLGPRVYSTGEVIIGAPGTTFLDSLGEARSIAERLATWGAIGLKQYYQPRRAQRQWITEIARERGDVFVTGEGMDFAYDLSMVMDGQTAWEHPILDIPLYGDVVQFLAQAGVTYNPELITPGQGLYIFEYFMSRSRQPQDPKQQRWVHWDHLMRKKNHAQRPLEEYPAVLSAAAVKDIVRAGGRVGVGGHGQEQGLGTHWEIWTFGFALDPVEALEAATLRNAQYLGLDRDLGSLRVGKLADLVILDADPLADLRNSLAIDRVMIDGRLFDAQTLDEVWPRARPYGPRRWTVQHALGETPAPAR